MSDQSSRMAKLAVPAWHLLVASVIIVGFFIASTIYTQRMAARLDADATSIAINASPSIVALSTARGAAVDVELSAARARQESASQLLNERAVADASIRRLRASETDYLTNPFYPGEREHWAPVDEATQQFLAGIATYFAALQAGRLAEATTILRARIRPAAAQLDSGLAFLVDFNAAQQNQLGIEIPIVRRNAARAAYLLDAGGAVLAALLIALVMRESRRRQELLTHFNSRLEQVVGAIADISGAVARDDEQEAALNAIVRNVARVLDADYAALGFAPFVFYGFAPDEVAAIGRLPEPVGILGEVLSKNRTIRLENVADDPAFPGLPAGHPPIGPFLGVPIRRERRGAGHGDGILYLARRPGRPGFTEEDEHIAELLAAQAAVSAEQARLHEQMRRAVQARSDLLAIVSHDLRNPLHVIRMATSVLQRSDALPEEHRLQAAHRILRAADGMNRLIEDLLAASKIESGTFSVDRRNPESIESLLSDAVELFVEVAAAKSVSLEKRLGGAPASVSCDRGRVLQVFSNLIGNALKFTPPGGTVTISADQIADEARFAVCDTGPGIPEAQRTAVFSRYWQAKKGDGGGTGLGLYIVKGIVEAHGGKVWIDSGPEGGACVRFTLPLAHVRRSPDVAPAQRLLKRTT